MSASSYNRILIVDGHPMMREGLRTLISRERDLTVCGEAETAGQALDAVANLKPDLVLTEITLLVEAASSSLKTFSRSSMLS